MAKKSFNNPTKVNERKGIEFLIGEQTDNPDGEKSREENEPLKYSTYNVRVRQDYKEKIYNIKGKTGKSFTDIFDIIFDDYFTRNS